MKEKRTLHHWLHVRSTHAGRGPSSGGEVPGRAAQDTPRVHPCRLGFGHPWPNTVLGSPARHLAGAKRSPPRVRVNVWSLQRAVLVGAGLVGAGTARERVASATRRDTRDVVGALVQRCGVTRRSRCLRKRSLSISPSTRDSGTSSPSGAKNTKLGRPKMS